MKLDLSSLTDEVIIPICLNLFGLEPQSIERWDESGNLDYIYVCTTEGHTIYFYPTYIEARNADYDAVCITPFEIKTLSPIID